MSPRSGVAGKPIDVELDTESECSQSADGTRRNAPLWIHFRRVDRSSDTGVEPRGDMAHALGSLFESVEQGVELVFEAPVGRQSAVELPSAVRLACARVRCNPVSAALCQRENELTWKAGCFGGAGAAVEGCSTGLSKLSRCGGGLLARGLRATLLPGVRLGLLRRRLLDRCRN